MWLKTFHKHNCGRYKCFTISTISCLHAVIPPSAIQSSTCIQIDQGSGEDLNAAQFSVKESLLDNSRLALKPPSWRRASGLPSKFNQRLRWILMMFLLTLAPVEPQHGSAFYVTPCFCSWHWQKKKKKVEEPQGRVQQREEKRCPWVQLQQRQQENGNSLGVLSFLEPLIGSRRTSGSMRRRVGEEWTLGGWSTSCWIYLSSFFNIHTLLSIKQKKMIFSMGRRGLLSLRRSRWCPRPQQHLPAWTPPTLLLMLD